MLHYCAICNTPVLHTNLLYWQKTPEGGVPFCCAQHATLYHYRSEGGPNPEHLSPLPPKPSTVEPEGWWDGTTYTPNPERDRAAGRE